MLLGKSKPSGMLMFALLTYTLLNLCFRRKSAQWFQLISVSNTPRETAAL